MTALNRGIAILNDRPLQEPAGFCVLGTAGGGTTMTARLLEAAGVFMGGRMEFNAEDPQFALLLKQLKPDVSAFDNLVARRNAVHRRWGFKAPFRLHWNLLSRIENVRFVTIFRDVLATGMRTTLSSGAHPLQTMTQIFHLQKGILDFMATSDRPNLVLSYEKALVSPDETARAVLQFVGIAETEPLLARMCAIVRPNEPAYVAGQAGLAHLRR